MGVLQTMPISFGHFPSDNPPTFPALEPGKIPHFRRYFMKTGLNKRQKITAIFFDEYGDLIEVQTHNTELKKRLSKFATMYPDHCRQTDDDEQGGLTFEIEKGRLSFRLTAPYSAERRKTYSKNAKEKGMKGSAKHQEQH